ncbi:zincin-like metallopeptidase domain-containing protein [Salmonella enterica subsp. enterica serovar Chester]
MNTSLHPDDICRFITGRLAGSLVAGQVPWHGTVPGLPEHALTGVPFTGVNVLLLWQAMQQRSLRSRRWLTGDDLRRLGGRVRNGEKPVTLVRYRPSLSLFKVINPEQCDGLPDELQPLWPLPPRPQPSLNVVRDLLQVSGIPVIHRDNILPVYRALHDRIELPPAAAYAGEETYWQDILNLLVQATGHPQRLHRFGLTVDMRTDEVQEALVAELGAAFLTASLGLPGKQSSRHDVAPWVSFLHDDPWRLFKAADAARRAMTWLSERRPAMTTVEMWQKMAALILETHYGLSLSDTMLGCRSVTEHHLECGITPLMAINALARIYQWERCDQPQRSLFLSEAGPDSEILTLSEIRPELLTCYRIPAPADVPAGETERVEHPPLLPAPVVQEDGGAANDDGPDDPDGNDNVVALPWAARRGKTNPHVQRFVSLFNQTAPEVNRWQVFSDFVHMAACSLYNAIHRDEAFEADYMQRVSRYSREDANNMSRLLAEVIEGLEFCPTDFLGQIFMNLELGNTRHGQYFTPYNVCYTMSRMTLSDRLSVLTSGERDFITVSDPACGAGGMIVAMAEAMLEAGFNPQKQMMVYCVDIDPVAAMMCYIQLSLMGIPAIVATGNSLTVAIKREMATPMFVLGHWHNRWQAERTHQVA